MPCYGIGISRLMLPWVLFTSGVSLRWGIRGDCRLCVLRDPDGIEPRGCKRSAEMPRPWWYFRQSGISEDYSHHLAPACPVLLEMSITLTKELRRGRLTVILCSDCGTNKVEKCLKNSKWKHFLLHLLAKLDHFRF